MSLYDYQLPDWQEKIRNTDTNDEMKSAILKLDKQWGTRIRPATRIFYLKTLKIFSEYFRDKAPAKITKDDLIDFFDALPTFQHKRGARLVEQIKISVKKFFRDFYGTKTYPELVDWIRPKRCTQKTVNREMLLTPEEIKRIVETCDNSRDKAFVIVLAESGFRIGEILGIKLKDIVFGENGVSINVDGKTGPRKVPLIHSIPAIKEWINNHPHKNDPESFLWVCLHKNHGEAVRPDSMRSRLKQIAKKAKIEKRVWCHLFRHTQITTLIRNGMPDSHVKMWSGWSQRSTMMATYSHLVYDDLETKYQEMNGMTPKLPQSKESIMKSKNCPKCGEVNIFTNKVCNNCLCVLDLQTAIELEEKRKQIDDLMNVLMQKPRIKAAIEAELSGIIK